MKKLFTLLVLMLTAIAVNAVNYNVWVAGKQVTDDNKNDVLGDGKKTVTYNPTYNSLQLKNATITSSSSHAIEVGKTDSPIELSIYIEGTNTINASKHGITVQDGSTCSIYTSVSTCNSGVLTINNATKGGFAIQLGKMSSLYIMYATVNATSGAGISARETSTAAKLIKITASEVHVKSNSTSPAIGNAKSIGVSYCTVPSGTAFSSSLYSWAANGSVCKEVNIYPKTYDIMVAGKQVTARNCGRIAGTATSNVSYDPDKNTLILDNYTIEGGDNDGIYAPYNLNVAIEGKCKITSTGGHGIYIKGKLALTGSGPYSCSLDIITSSTSRHNIVYGEDSSIKNCALNLNSKGYCIVGNSTTLLTLDKALLDMKAAKSVLNIGYIKYIGCYMSFPDNAYFDSTIHGITTNGTSKNVTAAKTLIGTDNLKPILPSDKSYSFVNISESSITLIWNPARDNNGSVKYRVCYALGSSMSGMTNVAEQNLFSYTFTGLQPSTEYKFEIIAIDEAGNATSYGMQKHATADIDYGLIVDGKKVTSSNAKNITGDGGASYNASTKTLILNNAKLTSSISSKVDNLIIELKGASTSSSYMQFAGNTTIKGTGSFTSKVSGNLGIYLYGGNLTIESGTVDVSGHTGIKSDGKKNSLTVKKGATFYATGSQYGSIIDLKSLSMTGSDFMSENGLFLFDTNYQEGTVKTRGGIRKTKVGIGDAYLGISIDGKQVTTSNEASYVNSKFDYNKTRRELTLNGYSGKSSILFDKFDTDVILKGSNTTGMITANEAIAFSGTGSLTIKSNDNCGIYGHKDMSFEDCTISASGLLYGITGTGTNVLTIKNADITAQVTGTNPSGSICDFSAINMTDVGIKSPSGAKVSGGSVVDNKGNKATGKVVITDNVAPVTAKNYTLTAEKVTDTSAKVSFYYCTDNRTWQSNLVYHLYVAKTKITGMWMKEYDIKGSSSQIVEGLTPGVKYWFRLKATDEAGNSRFYDDLEFDMPTADAIEEVTADDIADGKVYNTSGVLVGKNYKGVVIKNGKKYILK